MLALVGVMGLASCDKYLDKMPDNRTELDTKEKINDMLVAAYPSTNYAEICEMTSDNTDHMAGANYSALNSIQEKLATWKDVTSEDNDSPYALWNACYHAIASANMVLQAISELPDPESMAAQKAEALICRAYNHFILTNIFTVGYRPSTASTDLGIPYVKTVETTVSPTYDRGSVADDYAEMEKDILEALPNINNAIHEITSYHFNKKAAYAFAARFYLYYVKPDKSNYQKVIEYAYQVLGSDPASSLRDWQTVGGLTPNGGVRQTQFVDASEPANLLLYSTYSTWDRICGPYGLGTKYIHGKNIADTETSKTSKTLWGASSQMYFTIPQYSQLQKVIMPKIDEFFEYTDVVNRIGIVHIMFPAILTDEVILNRAEAYTMLGQYDKALEDLNTFVHKFTKYTGTIDAQRVESVYGPSMAYYTPTNPTPKKALNPDFAVEQGQQENFIQAILHTRRILTLHEGLRWFDVKRYGLKIYRRTYNPDKTYEVTDSMDVNDPRRAIQIPEPVVKAGLPANPR